MIAAVNDARHWGVDRAAVAIRWLYLRNPDTLQEALGAVGID